MDVNDPIFRPGFNLQSPYTLDYFGLWMIDEKPFRSAVARIQGKDLHVHLQQVEVKQQVDRDKRRMFALSDDGVALFEARGPMMKFVSSMSDGTSYIQLRRQINSARKDDDVRGAILVMDTPGGTAKGNEDLANDIAKFAEEKPIFAFVEDLTASAGVSLASQATKRYANNATAMYGAMGTYAVVQDLSGMAEQLGVVVHVIKAGEFKGAGEPGTEVTEKQIEEIQRIVDRVNDNYLGLIARGLHRSVDSVRELADGRIIMASDAVSDGLINGIQSLEATKQELLDMVASDSSTSVLITETVEEPEMADNPATLKELKETFPNSTAEWREKQLENSATITDAAISYARSVEESAEAKEKEHEKQLAEAKAEAKLNQPSSSLGHQPFTVDSLSESDVADSGDPAEDFSLHVFSYMKQYNCSRRDAITAVKRKHPQLTQRYLLATNPGKRQQRELEERFDGVNRTLNQPA